MKSLEFLQSFNAKSELARRNLIDFVQYTKPDYDANWHHELLCSYLQRFIEGDIKRLMIFMPPQTGKSQIVSRHTPAYILGKFPKAKIVLSSYSAHLSESFNRDCQRIIDSKEYTEVFPNTKLSSSNVVSKSGNWLRNSEIFEVVEHGGFLKTVGVGGPLTGTPADFAIIDDPVKDSIEAMSPTYQQRNWDWFNAVLYTRIHNDSRILITQTRWDVNDLSGKLIKSMEEGGEQWTILKLQGIRTTEENKEDPRKPGEALWPKRHSLEKMERIRSRSIRTFEALYQQNPKPMQAGGEFWRSFNTSIHVKPKEICQYDAANTLHVIIDNNVNPYVTVAIWQYVDTDKRLKQIDELPCTTPDNNAPRAAKRLIAWLNKHQYDDVLYLYGDPSAKAKSTIDENNSSFFEKFIDELKKAGFKVINRVGRSAPQIAISAAFINDIYAENLYGYGIEISDKCITSIEDYYSVKEDKDGTMQKIKRKDPSTGVTYEPYGHFSDAKRYFVTTILAEEFARYKGKPKKMRSVSV